MTCGEIIHFEWITWSEVCLYGVLQHFEIKIDVFTSFFLFGWYNIGVCPKKITAQLSRLDSCKRAKFNENHKLEEKELYNYVFPMLTR